MSDRLWKAIALWQPWASLWCSPSKVHETRHWPTAHRGWLAVHATKKFVRDVDEELDVILVSEFGRHWGMDLPTGCIIGGVRVFACKRTETVLVTDDSELDDRRCGDFSAGRYAWERDRFFLLKQPIPCRGQRGMWTLSAAISAKLEAESA